MRYRIATTLRRFGVIALGISAAGCGGGDGRYSVGGAVTYDGQPVERGSIGFLPVDGAASPPAGGEIANGVYAIPRAEGPGAGDYLVVIYAERGTGRFHRAESPDAEAIEQLQQYLPPTYNDQTTLTARIESDRTDLDFALEKPRRGSRR